MRKKCLKCGKDFEARESYHKLCPDCHKGGKAFTEENVFSSLLLPAYYDTMGNLVKEVFLDTPKKLAAKFAEDAPPLGTKQLRDFLNIILKARNKAIMKGIESARPTLYRCEADLEYQEKRKVIPKSFADFMRYHLAKAAEDDRALEGFYQHLDSIVCYFPTKK